MCPSFKMHLHDHVLLLFLSWLLLAQPTVLGTSTTNITSNLAALVNSTFFTTKPGCQSTCGNVTVPYPFGIGDQCSIRSWFNLTCDDSSNPPTLILTRGQPNPYVVLSIAQTKVSVAGVGIDLCNDDSNIQTSPNWEGNMGLADSSPYAFSDTANKFTVIGCDAYGQIQWQEQGLNFTTGCFSSCPNNPTLVAELAVNCSGVGCCQVAIPKGIKNFNGTLGSFGDRNEVISGEPCISMFLVDIDTFQFSTSYFEPAGNVSIVGQVPVALDFVVSNQSCADAEKLGASLCQINTSCNDTNIGSGGYFCSCKYGFAGNPYLGCTEIDMCSKTGPILNDCDPKATCQTTSPGNFACKCPAHSTGDGTTCSSVLWIELSLGLGFGLLSLLIVAIGLYFSIQRRKLVKLREQFFQQNGGLLMKQKISSIDGTESSKFFTIEELKKATNNYAEDRILGHGGYGVVYKGILPDQRIVAIKKSKVIDRNQVEQFVNELLILTQVNHRNVVKLLGCCFETEVPQLVYEYIANGTLFEHIHKTSSRLTLEYRLRIAIEAANALSYLHSAASPPIIHRDIKSPNILLDANYVAKVADFGASRLVPLDQTEVATLVQGTLGYLDPEYFHSSQLTEKSDVYSFGVVLAELLTGRKPICLTRPQEERSLATHLIMSLKENKLFQIVEPRLLREGTLDQLQAFAELVKRCLSLKGEDRPSMREVVMELEGLKKFKKDPWVNQESRSEGEILRTQEAARVDTNTERFSTSFNCSLMVPR